MPFLIKLIGGRLKRTFLVWVVMAILTITESTRDHFSGEPPDLFSLLDDDIPATLESSAFANDLYHGLSHPYKSYPCMPKRIHLSQASNLEPNNSNNQSHRNNNDNNNRGMRQQQQRYDVDMTVSFSLDYEKCGNVIPTIMYEDVDGNDQARKVRAIEKQHFNYTSPRTGAYFQSDWIYHVTLPKLRGGLVKYGYTIQVDTPVAADANDETTSIQRDRRHRHLKNTVRPPATPDSSHLNNDNNNNARVAITPSMFFLTPPNPGQPTTIALIGDLGQTGNSTVTMAHIQQATMHNHSYNPSESHQPPVSMLVFAGDMSYADSEMDRWTHWFDLMEPLLRQLPTHVAAGNHEIECDNATLETFVPYENYFRVPNRITPAEIRPITEDYRKSLWNGDCATPSEFQVTYNFGNAFYAFDHGLVHTIVLSSYSDTSVGSVQYQWLLAELEHAFDRSKTPWLLVSFHCPLYTTFVGHNKEVEAQRMQASMEKLFAKYGVNLIVSGHDHAYMRTHSLSPNGRVDPSGKSPIYVTVGAGGNREGHAVAYKNETTPEPWVAKRTRYEYGYGHLFVSNATHARLKWVRDGTTKDGLQDDVWLINVHVG